MRTLLGVFLLALISAGCSSSAAGRSGADAGAHCPATCPAHATCPADATTCSCDPGYAGDGSTCTALDNCSMGQGGCDRNATCTTTGPATNACTCNSGYSGDGKTCVPIDNCAAGEGGCDAHATCTATGPGMNACTCQAGYVGDGRTCQLTYAWVASGFGACQGTCGTGTRTQTVVCQGSDGSSAPASSCDAASMPATAQSCSLPPCGADTYGALVASDFPFAAWSLGASDTLQGQCPMLTGMTSGTVVSGTSGTGVCGIVQGAVSSTDSGPLGAMNGEATFDGSSSFIQLGSGASVGSPAFSIVLWVKTTTTTQSTFAVQPADSIGGSWTLSINGAPEMTPTIGNVDFTIAAQDTIHLTTTGLHVNDGGWHLIVVERQEAGALTLDVDGAPRANGTEPQLESLSSAGIVLGASFVGELADMALFNRALSADETAPLLVGFNTPSGQQVHIDLPTPDPTMNITLQFDSVDSQGVSMIQTPALTEPLSPNGWTPASLSSIPMWYQASTGAHSSGNIQVCVVPAMSGLVQGGWSLFQSEGGVWEQVGMMTSAGDAGICGTVKSLALPFAVMMPVTYMWTQGGYGSCSVECGGGTQTQTISCLGTDGTTDPTGEKCTGPVPPTSQTCNTDACPPPTWIADNWSDCSVPCGGGTQTRSVVCVAQDMIDPTGEACAGQPEPATSQSCNPQSCPP